MKDRELLEAAARAAGMETRWEQNRGAKDGWLRARYTPTDTAFPVWNPLQDLSQATELMLRLSLRVDYVDGQPCVEGVMQHGRTVEESFCRAVVCASCNSAKGKT